jgi:CheY-like chemotaxis protein
MKRILFVDDETSILDGLKRMLRPMRTEWEMAFAPGGEAALSMMEAAPMQS